MLDGLFWYGTPNTKQIAGIIVANVPDGSDVIIENLTVDESGVTTKPAGADYLAGVFYRETGGTIDTVSVVGGGSWSEGDRGYGIYLSAATNTVPVEVKGSSITNFDKNGIEAHGNKLTVNIHYNTITGRGPISDEVQNGVHVGRDAVGTVNYNTISNLSYQPETWWSAAILFYHYVLPTGKSATAIGNTITNCQIGIIFNNANGWAQGNTVSGGTVGLVGIYAEPDLPGTWTTSFVNNTVSGVRDSGSYENAAIGANTYDAGASLMVNIDNNQLTSGSASADGIRIGEGTKGSIDATIKNNIISNWQHGIWLGLTCDEVTITGNTIANNILADSGVHIISGVDVSNIRVNFNNIFGNVGTDVYGVFNSGTGILDAENNWWGDITDPYHSTLNPSGLGDEVSDNVDFDPWLGVEVLAVYSETVPIDGEIHIIDGSDETDARVTLTTVSESLPDLTVIIAKYADNPHPEEPFPDAPLGNYFDIWISNPSAVVWPIYVEKLYSDSEWMSAGISESSLGLYYWVTPDTFHRCSDTGVNTAENIIWANVQDYEYGLIAAKEFAAGGQPMPVGGTLIPSNTLNLLAPWIILAVAIASTTIGAVVIIRRKA